MPVVAVDVHVALRRPDPDVGERLADRAQGDAARPADRAGQQADGEVGGFGIGRGRPCLGEGAAVGGDEGAIARAVDALEIDARADVPGRGLGPDLQELGLGEAAAGDGQLGGLVQAGLGGRLPEGTEEGVGRGADQRVEDEGSAGPRGSA